MLIHKEQFIYLFVLLTSLNLQSQQTKRQDLNGDRKLTFFNFDVEKGLSNNIIKTIEEDELGFIWIGTSEGINRYDGNQFKVYKQGSTALTDNFIQQIKKSRDGNLYIATNGGINIFNPRKNTFNSYQSKNSRLSNSTNSIVELNNGHLVVGVYGEGVHVLDDNQNEYAFFNSIDENPNTLSSNKISCISKENDSIIWIGTFDGGLNRLDLSTKKIKRIPYSTKDEAYINSVLFDKEGNLWIGSNDGLKSVAKNGVERSLNYSYNNLGLSNGRVTAIEEDDLGQLWIGTFFGGLNVIKKTDFLNNSPDFKVKWYLPKEDNSSIPNPTVLALKKDSSGNIWIGTSSGLSFVDPRGEAFSFLSNDLHDSDKIIHNRITGIEELPNKKLMLATDGAGIDIYDPSTRKFEYSVFSSNNKLSTNYVNTLLKDHSNNIWIGTYQGGLFKYNYDTGVWNSYLQGSVSEGSDVRVIFESFNNTIWVGTNRGGLYKYIPEQDKFEYIDMFGKIDVRGICESQNGVLWLATWGNGIARYDTSNNTFVSYHMANLKNLYSNVIYSITALSPDEVVAGTYDSGIVRFKHGDTIAKTITEDEGLSNNTVTSILKWKSKHLFLGTSKGLSKYNIETNKIEQFTSTKISQATEFNIGSILKSSWGNLYFGSNKGLLEFNPSRLKNSPVKETIIIKDLLVYNKSVEISDNEDAILDSSILYKDEITIPVDNTVFSIDFSSLRYPFSELTNYSYILEGFNENWIDLKNSNRINFSNIPPGDYTLKIRGTGSSNSQLYKELKIVIPPPFWRTNFAYVLYCILFMTMLWIAHKIYSERIHLKNSLYFEKKHRKLESELNEERIKFYNSYSHELKTPLTLILAPLEILLESKPDKEIRSHLKIIKKNAYKLQQFINKHLEYRKSEKGLSELEIGNYNLTKNLTNWLASYDPILKKECIELFTELPQKSIHINCDLEKVQIIFNNLMSNAIKFSPKFGKIQVILEQNDSAVLLRVGDSGKGINAQDKEHIFEWYYQSDNNINKKGNGIGLALSKRFAELHQGNLTVTSTEGQGSFFNLSIPTNLIVNKYPEEEALDTVNTKVIENQNNIDFELFKDFDVQAINSKQDTSKKLVLLIDDNLDILNFLNKALSQEYNIICAQNGEEGIDKATENIPDLIISDIMMPVKNGIDLCHHLKNKKETSHIPIILLSAKSNFEIIEKGYTEGADDYISKPFNVNLLKARISNLIESRSKLLKLFSESDFSEIDEADNNLLDVEKKFLLEFNEIILQNMQQGISTVEIVSKEIGMSRSSLYRKIKALTDQSINEYIRNIKIEHGAHLIKNEGYSVSQAAYEVGFGSTKYFRKIFKEKYGKSPSTIKPSQKI